MPTMTFEQFCAAARTSPDLSQDTDAAVRDQHAVDDADRAPAGIVYPGSLVIQDWAHAPIRQGGEEFRFYLMIGNREWLAHDRAALEPTLYEYYVSEQP